VLYDKSNVVQELASDGSTTNLLTGLGIDETMTRSDANGTNTLLVDTLGSPLALANGSGVVQTKYTYEPFGNGTISGASSTNTAQFTGRENDGTGLYSLRARYYSPVQQRFISEDPLGAAGGVNLYAYAHNRPTTFRDPFGLKPPSNFGDGGGDDDNGDGGDSGDSEDSGDSAPGQSPCVATILNALNDHFGTNFTSADIIGQFRFSLGAPGGLGTLNLNISGGPVPSGRFPLNWWTYAIGHGVTIHIPSGPGGADSWLTLVNDGTQFTIHLDSDWPYNPIGAILHWLGMTGMGGNEECPQ
jgi:RHS repeat-associated protein